MMKFDILREIATCDGTIVKATKDKDIATWVSDTSGVYAILDIDWDRRTVLVSELGFDDENDPFPYVIDTYSRTFIDMKDCTY